ncbi:hypothetical protein QE152_g3850 [Popillia japonica]|uniref:Uncharacterized protein n=1 Tax=Popillia japonica TaxID=7064 RepID=A0AAW1MYG4_POPJA
MDSSLIVVCGSNAGEPRSLKERLQRWVKGEAKAEPKGPRDMSKALRLGADRRAIINHCSQPASLATAST